MGLGLLSSLEPQTLQPDVARSLEVTGCDSHALGKQRSDLKPLGRVNTRPVQTLAGASQG